MNTPRSVESFRMLYGRTPTVAEFQAIMATQGAGKPTHDGRYCDYCYDPECSVCCDDEGNVR